MRLTARRRAIDRRLRKEYGITLVQYEVILKSQGDCCAICKKPASVFKVRLAVDHDHKSGLVRGCLCNWCNRLLGMVHDNRDKLFYALAYLGNPPASQALGGQHFTAPGRIGSKRRAKLLKVMRASGQVDS